MVKKPETKEVIINDGKIDITLRKGSTFHMIQYGIEKKEYKCHVLEIVDNSYVVFKWYGKHKQWWHYQVEHTSIVGIYIKAHKESKEKTQGEIK